MTRKTWRVSLVRTSLFFLLFLGIAWTSGALSASLGRFSDSASHFIGILTIREYVLNGLPGDPVAFAKDYYAHYPKVAIGHWPPFFYAVGALWTIVFGTSKLSVFSLYAVLGALFTETLWRTGSRLLGHVTGIGVAACGVLMLALQGYATSTMLELPMALLVLWATMGMARFLNAPTVLNSLAFGLLAAAAILTKGNALCLAFVPPIAAILARKPRILVGWPLWTSAALVVCLCLPWMLLTQRFVTRTFAALSVARYLPGAGKAYAGLLVDWIGIGTAALAVAGLILILIAAFAKSVPSRTTSPALEPVLRDRGTWASLGAAVLAFYLFHILTPSGWESRYWYAALGPVALLGGLGALVLSESLARSAHARRSGFRTAPIAGIIFALIFTELLWRFGEGYCKPETGMTAVAAKLSGNPAYENARVLVCCDSISEGSLIAEIALRRPNPTDSFMVLRATKELAVVDWNGREKGTRLSSPTEFRTFLHESPVDVVVYSEDPALPALPALRRLLEAVRSDPENWLCDTELSRERVHPKASRLHVYFQKDSVRKPRLRLEVKPF